MMNALSKIIDNEFEKLNDRWPKLNDCWPVAIVDDVVNDIFGGKTSIWTGHEKPSYPMNVIRVKNDKGETTAYRLEFALAGFDKQDIGVHVNGDFLNITASRADERAGKDTETVEYGGISYRKLSMSYRLLENADRDQIKSRFQNGLLSITIPVKEQHPAEEEGRSIEIE